MENCGIILFILSFVFGLLPDTTSGQLFSFPPVSTPSGVNWTPTPPPIPTGPTDTCPCKKPPGSNQCVSYDPKYAATTLEEAIFNFVDTTTADASNALTILGKQPAYKQLSNYASYLCVTNDCLGCLAMLAGKISQNLFAAKENSTEPTTGALKSLSDVIMAHGLDQSKTSRSCPGFNKPTPTPVPDYVKTPHGYPNFTQWLREHNQNQTRGKHPRPKRQSAPPAGTGTSSAITCDYRRGSPVDSSSNYCGLCSVCWSIRTLPDKYFPRYINERSCDQTDNRCLSGYGTCREIYRSIDVLYNYGTDDTPQWAQYSINSPVSCECQVQTDSAMYNFVKS